MKAWQKGLAILGFVGGWEASWWGVEQYRRKKAIDEAHAYADAVGKDVLNVGCCGSPVSTWGWIRQAGDVNCDLGCPQQCDGQGCCSYCDIYALPFADKEFGAVLCMHVLEHLDRPDDALRELERVAERVFAITPLPWTLQNILYPDHKRIFWKNADVGATLIIR